MRARASFRCLLPSSQIGYTRAGSFQTNAQGTLVTANGNELQPAITIPANATNVTVGSDGTVSVTLAGQINRSRLGCSSWRPSPTPAA